MAVQESYILITKHSGASRNCN